MESIPVHFLKPQSGDMCLFGFQLLKVWTLGSWDGSWEEWGEISCPRLYIAGKEPVGCRGPVITCRLAIAGTRRAPEHARIGDFGKFMILKSG